MSHRRTAVLSGGALAVLAGVATLLPVPYVAFSPGPTADVLGDVDGEPVIAIDGAREYDTMGRLDLTTVGVSPANANLGIIEAMATWLDSDEALVPRESVYPEGTTAEESAEANAALWRGSQDAAAAAALDHLGYEVEGVQRAVVSQVSDGSPAVGLVAVGDLVLAVDGDPVSSAQGTADRVSDREPGAQVELTLQRAEEELTVQITTTESADEPGRAVIGVGLADVLVGFESEVEVTIAGPENVGGSSAGLVFSLGIIDRMTPDSLLDGRHVAGTGEISPDGSVSRISGIAQKVSAAADEGAEFFLAPVGNCEDVLTFEPAIPVVPVHTLDEAVALLEAGADAGEVPPTRCEALPDPDPSQADPAGGE